MEVKLLRVITGEEIIAEIVEENAAEITLKNALVVIPTNQNVGFALVHQLGDTNLNSIQG